MSRIYMGRRASIVACFAYLAWLSLLSAHVAAAPAWNLDSLFYAACIDGGDAPREQQHARLYDALERLAPAAEVDALEQGSKYRQRLRKAAAFFHLQLPFYEAKPLYVWFGRLATWLGVAAVSAPYAVSAVCFVLIGVCMPLLAVLLGVSVPLSALACAVVMASPQVREACMLGTPDALCAWLLLLGLLLTRVHLAATIACFALSVVARPDSVVFALPLLGALLLTRPAERRWTWLGILALPALAILTSKVTGAYGWPVVMRHTFVKALSAPEQLEVSFGVRDYLRALWKGLKGHQTQSIAQFWYFLVPACVAVYASRDQPRPREEAFFLTAIWIGMIGHVFAFPVLADRFFLPAYVVTTPLALALFAWRYPWARAHANRAQSAGRSVHAGTSPNSVHELG